MSSGGGFSGFSEGLQRSFALEDAVTFRRFMLDLYGNRCAVTGAVFLSEDAQSNLEIFLFQPLDHGGAMSPGNAIVVEAVVAGLLGRGDLLISDAYRTYTTHPDIVQAPIDPRDPGGRGMCLPDNISLWPELVMIGYHRSLFRAQ